jgi:hypothetical protein
MPPVAAAAAAIAGTHVVGTVTIGAILQSAAISTAFSLAGQALARKSLDALGTGSMIQMKREPAPVARAGYGEVRVSGPITFAETKDESGQPNDWAYLVLPLFCHEVDAIGGVYFVDNRGVIIGPGNAAVGILSDRFWAYPHLGSSSQTADATLMGLSARWTSAHRGRGIAYLFCILRHNTAEMPALANVSALVRCRKVFDPRDVSQSRADPATWKWSDNPALCVMDYLCDEELGVGCDYADEIDEASFIAAANACDESVALAGGGVAVSGDTTNGSPTIEVASFAALSGLSVGMPVSGAGIPAGARIVYVEADTDLDPLFVIDAAATATASGVSLTAGGAERRYRCSAVWDTDAERGTVLEQLVATMAGELYCIGGRWICHAGVARVATASIGPDDLRTGNLSIQTRDDFRDTCNRVKGTFCFPGDRYIERPFPPVVNALYLAEDDGVELWRDLKLPWVQSAAAAQRIGKIHLETARQDITGTLPCKLRVAPIDPGAIVAYTDPELGWVGKLFRVVEKREFDEPQEGSEVPATVIDLDVREYSPDAYDWADGAETVVDPAPNTSLPPPA